MRECLKFYLEPACGVALRIRAGTVAINGAR